MFILVLPPILLYLNRLFTNPRVGIFTLLILAFVAIGLNRYIPSLPLGLSLDIMLVLTYVAAFFRFFNNKPDYTPFKTDLTILALLWFLYALFQIFNPEALSKTAGLCNAWYVFIPRTYYPNYLYTF